MLSDVADIAGSVGRTCARTTGGDVYCWGDSEFGKAGDGRLPDNDGREKTRPGKPILHGAATLAVAEAHACSALPDGRLSCWGQNNNGALGLPARVQYVPRPPMAGGLSGWRWSGGLGETSRTEPPHIAPQSRSRGARRLAASVRLQSR
jgi:hypothetical protein